jgi:hypothetical protein
MSFRLRAASLLEVYFDHGKRSFIFRAAVDAVGRARPVSPRSLALQAARERQTKVSTRADGQGPSGTAQAPTSTKRRSLRETERRCCTA